MKRILSMLLALALILACLPALPIHAHAEIIHEGIWGNLRWTLDEKGTLTIFGEGAMYDKENAVDFTYQNSVKAVVIKDGVTKIGSYSFFAYPYLTSVEIADTVTDIGGYAFFSCDLLTDLELPSSLRTIGNSAFYGCGRLTELDIPEGITEINYGAFSNCRGLTQVKLPASLKKIGPDAFTSCAKLTQVEIPASVTDIASYAFSNCSGLQEITFRGGAPTIGNNAFENVTTTASYPTDDATWTEEVRQNYGGSITWKGYTTGAAIVAQGTCGDNLTWKLDAEGTLTVSGTGYMDDYDEDPAPWKAHTTEIKKIILEEGVKDIGDDAFYGCSALTTVEMADSVIGIGSYAFAECGKLQHISIGAGVTNIRSFAFNGCDSLVAFSVDERNTVFSNDEHGVLFNKEKTALITAPATLSGAYTVPEGVLSLGSHAFNGCTGMTAVALPDSLTTISEYAFLDCAGLKAIEIPGNVTYIGHCAFFYCYGLDEIRFCGNIPSMADFAFSTVTAKAYYPGNNATWTSDRLKGYQGSITWTPYGPAIVAEGTCGDNLTWKLDAEGTLTISGTGAMTEFASVSYVPWYEHRDAIKTVNVQNGVTTLGSDAFRQCGSLSKVALPDSITSIGSNAFCACYALTEITIPAGVTEIAYSTFYACTGLTKVTIPEGVTTIGAEAFNNCSSLTEITLPAGVASIGDLAFNKCSKLADVHIPNSVVTIGKNAFANCTSLTGIDLPDSLIRIEESLFYYCTGLTSVEIPDSVTEIGFSAFDHCTALAEIDLGEGVELIEKYAFDSCTSLTKITIPDSITTIGNNIFYGCGNIQFNTYENGKYLGNAGNPYVALICAADTSVSSCEVNANTRVIAGGAFTGCENLASVTIPASVVSICQYAFYNCTTLAEVFYGGSATQWESVAIGNYNQALLAATLHTTTSGTCGDNLTWVLTEDGTITISGEGAMDHFTYQNAPWEAYRDQIRAVVIEDGVTGVGRYAFYGYRNITAVTLGKTVADIANSTFSYCTNLTEIRFPESVTNIGYWAFQGCEGLTQVHIPASVTAIGLYAFNDCDNLEKIQVAAENPNYCSDAFGVLFNKAKTVLLQYPQARIGDYQIPETVTTIEYAAFSGCSGLTGVTIPDSVTTIGNNSFRYCNSLTSVIIPDSVTTIGDWGFADCTGLTQIHIHEKLTSIANGAFSGCTGLTEIYYSGTQVQWNAITIDENNEALQSINIHYSCVDIATHWYADIREATCVQEGYERETCPCGYERNKVILPIREDHNLVADVCADCGAVKISEITFPDANFRSYISQQTYGADGWLTSKELSRVTEIDVSEMGIKDLTGIAYFTALKYLYCSSNQLTSLDVGHNPELILLSCTSNQLTSLDVSKNLALRALQCSENLLTSLDVSHNTELSLLSCYSNQLTGLDMSNNTALTNLYCYSNQLTSLDVSKNLALSLLACAFNQLTSLDVSQNPGLKSLYIWSNQLTSLDVSHNPALEYLNCNSNQLTSLDVSNNPVLEDLSCDSNQRTVTVVQNRFDLSALVEDGFDISKASNWKGGTVSGTILTATSGTVTYTYDMGNNKTATFTLKIDGFCNHSWTAATCTEPKTCSTCQATEGTAAGHSWADATCTTPKTCSVCQTTEGDVDPANHEPVNDVCVACAAVKISEITFPDEAFRDFITQQTYGADGWLTTEELGAVTYMFVDNSNVQDMNGIQYFTALKELHCADKQLTYLDISKNTALEYLNCNGNQLTALDVSENTALKELHCASNRLTELDVSKNTKMTNLWCYSNQLTELDLSRNLALESLNCYSNQLTDLDVSKNIALKELYCGSNQLASLDISNNTVLTEVHCASNQLTDLNVSNCTDLISLKCYSNQLTHLNASENIALQELVCGSNQRMVTAVQNRFDLSAFAENGFDITKASDWQGGTVSGNILTATADTVTYTYNMGNGYTETFTLKIDGFCNHSWTDATCTAPKTCENCQATEGVAAGHRLGAWNVVKIATPVADGQEKRQCEHCDYFETAQIPYIGYGIVLTGDLAQENTVYVDGLPYGVKSDGNARYVELPRAGELLLVTYSYHEGDGQDVHTQYPTGMKVYMVSDGKLTYVPELDDLLQYSGSSIRIVGKKGIRMITSLTKDNKKALTGKGLAGYKLLEYGTALCFASEIPAGDGLVLGRSFTRSNYAYKKGEADPVFASPGNLIQYTNVLVGFTLDQCKEDIAMRPYIILEDAQGNQVTLYGGTIYRSIGYIAYQNRNVFQPKTAAYNYVWELIHHVYGDKYDADYKG